MVSSLDRKLWRDLWNIKSQVIAISLVISAGIAMFVMYLSTFDSLRATQDSYYQQYRFADVFARLKRAPNRLETELRQVAGVAEVRCRVVVDVTIDLDGVNEPLTGRLISIPHHRRDMLNDLALISGRYIDPTKSDEVLVNEGFALARGLEPGATVAAVINGRRRDLTIVGIALSPEYVYTIKPGGLMPDESRFGLLWMGRRSLAAAFDMEGGFNDVSVSLVRSGVSADAGTESRARSASVIAALDRLLEPYGGLGSYRRELQTSHWYLDAEIAALQSVGLIVPVVFLAVAAFLLNIVLQRIVAVQRGQIAALKALGYHNSEIGWHYTKWSLSIALLGALLGIVAGAGLGSVMIELYNQYFRFPFLEYRLSSSVLIAALTISVGAALFGALRAVRKAVSMLPAEAMQPEAPELFTQGWLDHRAVREWLSPPARMVIRNLRRHPSRAMVSIVGIAFAAAILIVGMFPLDALREMLSIQFGQAQRQDLNVSFVEPVSARARHEMRRLPGVVASEVQLTAPVRLVAKHRNRQTAIVGLDRGARLNRVFDAEGGIVEVPIDGLLLSRKLGELLGVTAGDSVRVEALTGRRRHRKVEVTGVIDDYLGTSAYMERNALQRLLGEGPSISGASLMVDPAARESLFELLKTLPSVGGVAMTSAVIESFEATIAENVGVMIFFNVLFAGVIAFGVIYNAARTSLSERGRELASLRVLGFTEAEIAFILFGELAFLTIAAIPLGVLLGYGLAVLVVQAFDTELYRLPLVISTRTYGLSIATVLASALVSAAIVRRRLQQLDLIEVLKTRE